MSLFRIWGPGGGIFGQNHGVRGNSGCPPGNTPLHHCRERKWHCCFQRLCRDWGGRSFHTSSSSSTGETHIKLLLSNISELCTQLLPKSYLTWPLINVKVTLTVSTTFVRIIMLFCRLQFQLLQHPVLLLQPLPQQHLGRGVCSPAHLPGNLLLIKELTFSRSAVSDQNTDDKDIFW